MPATPQGIDARVIELADGLRRRGERLVTAESCTGGLIAAACTALAGSSDWFERGLVTYSNAAKTACLNVDANLIATHGAVSEPVARAMALGALRSCETPSAAPGPATRLAHWAVAVTGIAGPGGGSPDKPVGTVWLAWAWMDGAAMQAETAGCRFDGDRHQVRARTVAAALDGLVQRIRRTGP